MADRDAPDAGLLLDGARSGCFGGDQAGAQSGHSGRAILAARCEWFARSKPA
jgi:hypothetical protein